MKSRILALGLTNSILRVMGVTEVRGNAIHIQIVKIWNLLVMGELENFAKIIVLKQSIDGDSE